MHLVKIEDLSELLSLKEERSQAHSEDISCQESNRFNIKMKMNYRVSIVPVAYN